MSSDDVIWQVINNEFCSFKVRTDTGPLCRNEYNVTGQCNKISCPLANSKYATVREVQGICYLFVKIIERSHMPASMWEKIKLLGTQEQVDAKIDKHLEYMPEFYRAKCKARYLRYQECMKRSARLENDPHQPLLTHKNKKVARREQSREERSKKVAQIENAIERELLERLQKGVYGDIYNLPQQTFDSILNKHGQIDELEEDAEDDEDEQFIEDEDEDDVEYVDDFDMTEDEDMEDGGGNVMSKSRRNIEEEVEYEFEREVEEDAPSSSSHHKY